VEAGGGEPAGDDEPAADDASGDVRPIAAGQLPLTGSETVVVALLGLGLLLAGAGLRLRLVSNRR
jgi:LPXTG-motif cell wall-anchored protein